MEEKKAPRVFVIGFMGSDRKGLGEKLAAELGYELLDLDREIEREDGRDIRRICMMMGEHEYRNKEYEMLEKLSEREKIVVVCGDGVILDDMSREILRENQVVLADWEKTPQQLWEQAEKQQADFPYAFMNQPDTALKKEKFMDLYEQRKNLYNTFVNPK